MITKFGFIWIFTALSADFIVKSSYGQSPTTCNPMLCIESNRVQNIFLRPLDASGLPPPIICDQTNPSSLFGLIRCWSDQCGAASGQHPTIVNAVRTIMDVCGSASFKLPEAIRQCRIFYPSRQAPQLSPDLLNQCILSTSGRSRQAPLPATIEARITNFFTFPEAASIPSPLADDPYMPPDLSGNPGFIRPGYRPIAGTSVSEMDRWDDSMLTSNWQWSSLSNAVASPNFQLVFPQSTLPFTGSSALGQTSLMYCLQISEVMDCTLARTCGPDLGQVMKALAMVYLGCSAVVKTSAVCDVNRVRYCMRVNGGNIFDVFDLARYTPYCQNYRAILSCIDKDCPSGAAGNADLRLLEQYKFFLQKFCMDQAYQSSVVRASVNCPIFQNATVFPATPDSMMCANRLILRQPIVPEPNLCTIVEANTFCLAQPRGCIYADVIPQKMALLDMVGCNPSGVLRIDFLQQTATGGAVLVKISNLFVYLWMVSALIMLAANKL